MKTTALTGMVVVMVLGAFAALPSLAQTGPGYGQVRGAAQAGQSVAPMGGMAGMHGGRGGMHGMRGGMGGRGVPAAGAGLMIPEERAAHQEKMRNVKTIDECRQVQAEQHSAMEARAKEKGVALPALRGNPCDTMKARGLVR